MNTNDYYKEKFGKVPSPKKQSELTWFQISKMLDDYHQQQLKILNIPVVMQRSELLAFMDWVIDEEGMTTNEERTKPEIFVDDYIKANSA
jgi:hypothetical protein